MEKEGGKRGGKFGEGMRDRLVSKVSSEKNHLRQAGWRVCVQEFEGCKRCKELEIN